MTATSSGVGGPLLRRVIAAYPEAKERVPALRMIVAPRSWAAALVAAWIGAVSSANPSPRAPNHFTLTEGHATAKRPPAVRSKISRSLSALNGGRVATK
jgi:hypothetical protein